jgi:hypothetical protein
MHDPFIMTTEKTCDTTLMKEMAKKWREDAIPRAHHPQHRAYIAKFDENMKDFRLIPEPRDNGEWEAFGGSRNVINRKENFELFLKRLWMAALGGAFLIAPMLLMVLQKSLFTTLLTTSFCVVAFGFIMAFCLKDPFNVMSATAAYAAVLVVFVGNGGGS